MLALSIVLKCANLLSVRHINRHAWLIFAKAQLRNKLLLHTVTINMKPEPTTFRTSMTRRSLREDVRIEWRVLPIHCLSPWLGESDSTQVVLLARLRILGAAEPKAGRSCHTKIPVRMVLMRISSTMTAIAACGSMPILHIPV